MKFIVMTLFMIATSLGAVPAVSATTTPQDDDSLCVAIGQREGIDDSDDGVIVVDARAYMAISAAYTDKLIGEDGKICDGFTAYWRSSLGPNGISGYGDDVYTTYTFEWAGLCGKVDCDDYIAVTEDDVDGTCITEAGLVNNGCRTDVLGEEIND